MTDWLQPEQFPVIVCRPALPKDTPEVLELTQRIWEGEDYVPHVWEEWLADPEGLLAVAEYGGRIAGLGKLSQLSEMEWWLEGLRVHPDLEGRGIASRLHGYLTVYWEQNLSGVLRLATASFRAPVQHLSERTGFQKVGEFTIYKALPLEPQPEGSIGSGFQPLKDREAAQALGFIQDSNPLPGSTGLMDIGWQWASPSIPTLEEAIRRGQAWWWRKELGQHGLLLANDDEEDDGETIDLRIQLLNCPLKELAALLLDFRKLAHELGYAQTSWMAPLNPSLIPFLDSAGFHREWDASLFLYEKAHPSKAPSGR